MIGSGEQSMVLDKQGYDELVMYLTQNLALFEKPGQVEPGAPESWN